MISLRIKSWKLRIVMSVKDRQGLFLNGTSHLTLISFKVRPILNCLKKIFQKNSNIFKTVSSLRFQRCVIASFFLNKLPKISTLPNYITNYNNWYKKHLLFNYQLHYQLFKTKTNKKRKVK